MTDSIVTIGDYLIDQIKTNRATLHPALGENDVYYGDQNNIPRTPSVCMDPGEKTRELNGVPRRALTKITNYILVYHGPVKSLQEVRKEDDQLAEAIETLIHADSQMGGLVIDSLVNRIESGYLQRNRTFFRASRLTVEATQQVQLPSSVS